MKHEIFELDGSMESAMANCMPPDASPLVDNLFASLFEFPTAVSAAKNKKSLTAQTSQYFSRSSRLNNYATILLKNYGTELEEVKVVIEHGHETVTSLINMEFKREVEKLSLTEILFFLKKTQKKFKKIIRSKEKMPSVYFEDLVRERINESYVFSVMAQLILEKFTEYQSRIMVVEVEGKNKLIVVVREFSDSENYFVLDLQSKMESSLHLQRVEELMAEKFIILTDSLLVSNPAIAWSDGNKSITIIGANGKELDFKISGRTPTEKRFRKEEEFFQKSKDTDLVPVEIYFLPYYRPLGHTAIRVGESLYELSMKGWKLHGDGTDSARAFLFNNPFFKNQYAIMKKFGMLPVSFGKTILVEKKKLIELKKNLGELVRVKTKEENKFNILTNNCNQGVMRVLDRVGIKGFETKGYIAFSSVLSFRKFLLDHPYEAEALNVYPLPNTTMTEESFIKFFPHLIYKHNSIGKEFKRTFPRYFHNILYVRYDKIRKRIKGIFASKEKVVVG